MKTISINSSELENEIKVFEKSLNNIKNIFDSEKKNLTIVNNGHSWIGKSQEAMYNKQVSFQQNFDPIVEALELFINYLKKTLEDYNRAIETQIKNIDENNDNFDVN